MDVPHYNPPFDPFDRLRAGQLRVTFPGYRQTLSIGNPNSF
jgi:hypothetical protein